MLKLAWLALTAESTATQLAPTFRFKTNLIGKLSALVPFIFKLKVRLVQIVSIGVGFDIFNPVLIFIAIFLLVCCALHTWFKRNEKV